MKQKMLVRFLMTLIEGKLQIEDDSWEDNVNTTLSNLIPIISRVKFSGFISLNQLSLSLG